MHPATEFQLQFFDYEHLHPALRQTVREFHTLAFLIASGPENPETTHALVRLLAAKDHAVRALVADGAIERHNVRQTETDTGLEPPVAGPRGPHRSAWREHEKTRCAATMPLVDSSRTPLRCNRPAGHDGGHTFDPPAPGSAWSSSDVARCGGGDDVLQCVRSAGHSGDCEYDGPLTELY